MSYANHGQYDLAAASKSVSTLIGRSLASYKILVEAPSTNSAAIYLGTSANQYHLLEPKDSLEIDARTDELYLKGASQKVNISVFIK